MAKPMIVLLAALSISQALQWPVNMCGLRQKVARLTSEAVEEDLLSTYKDGCQFPRLIGQRMAIKALAEALSGKQKSQLDNISGKMNEPLVLLIGGRSGTGKSV